MNISKMVLMGAGTYCLAHVIFHLFFIKFYNWKEELDKLSPVPNGVVKTLFIGILFIFAFMAYVSLLYTDEMLTTGLGKVVLVGFSLFWLARTVEGFFFFEVTKQSILIASLFLLGAVLFMYPVIF